MCENIKIWFEKLRNLTGWRRLGVAYMLGVLAAFSFPPFHLVPLLWIAFPCCFFLLQSCRDWRRAFAVGWWFSFGLLTVSLYWIAGALFVDLKSFWWLVPFAVAGLPALFALYYGFAAMIAWWWGLEKRDGLIIFALCWFMADYARGHLFTGFPWDVMGYVWAGTLPMMQMASVVGIYGLTLGTLLFAMLPAVFGLGGQARPVRVFFVGLFLMGGIFSFGLWRLSGASDVVVPDVRLRLVQPNVNQSEKWNHEDRDGRFRRLLETTFKDIESATPSVTHVVWPETATPFLLMEDPVARDMIAREMSKGVGDKKRILLTGGLRRKQDEKGVNFYLNALLVLDEKARILGAYDKHHLVPFGEYIPFADYLPIRSVVSMGADFMSGEGVRSLRTFGLPPFSPLVCYEAIFSSEVVDQADRPSLMVNVTNDGWYEGTIGPAQHFEISRMRAVEEGIPLVRVANKGVVAVVDAYGRIKAYQDVRESSFIDSDLPGPLLTSTLFSKLGDNVVFFAAWGIFFAALWLKKRNST